MSRIRGIALNPGEHKHFIDHLAPTAIALGVPLLFHTLAFEEEVKSLYPGLRTEYLPFEEFNPEWLIANYDVSILSDQWERHVFHEKFSKLELKYGKRMRNIHCPHGFSDKGFYLQGCAKEDICLVYGQNMLDLLEHWDALRFLSEHVFIGNLRLKYYREQVSFYTPIIQERVLDHFLQKQPILLYAPTCMDLENSSAIFEIADTLIKQLPYEYNLILKIHPQIEQTHPVEFYSLLAKYEKKPNVLFITDLSLIYPLLDVCSIYLGDLSAIGYDFLAFNKPMFFLNHQKRVYPPDRGVFLFQCGTVIEPENFPHIFRTIEAALPGDAEQFGAKREEIYRYTFGEEKAFAEIKKDLLKILYQSP